MVSDDIVKYLRLSRTRFNRHAEAADEIERLRAELKQWQALCDTYYHKLALEPDNTFYFISGYRYLASGGK